MNPAANQLYAVCDATWPPAKQWTVDGWRMRDGAGGGKRVSAATIETNGAAIEVAEADMQRRGMRPLFMVRDGDAQLDAQLQAHSYRVVDPVTMYACPTSVLTDTPIPPVTAFSIWEPLAIMEEIWEQGGIGPDRVAVMHRALQKTAVFARARDKPAGVGFAAIFDGVCMVHAVEVLPHQRRKGVAQWIMRKAAFWAQEQGANTMSVLCTQANVAANALYTSLGMDVVGHYHYRQKEA